MTTDVVDTRIYAPGLVIREHEFSVPLDHDHPEGATIAVFARELADPDGADEPYLVFFQGGPGTESPRPTGPPTGWLARALKEFRVLLLDQRGTGRSTPVGALPGMTPEEQADYLTHFRADSIVRDAELIRQALGVERWSVLGQSFGGFCVMTYLSFFPNSLREAFITGGLAPIGIHVDAVYRRTYDRVLKRNRTYYDRYPADRDRVGGIIDALESSDIRLPCGDRLTNHRF
ncbi:MAG TPA: alpha/beta fold hydrolase, partial [Chloroflexota bacterium]|nr:alpha/beta fold hydrolase [Chloroflexota bacterium]